MNEQPQTSFAGRFVPLARRARRLLHKIGTTPQLAMLALVAFVVVRPLFLVVWGAVRSASPGTPGAEYSLQAARETYGDSMFWEAVRNSLIISIVVTTLAISIGIGITWLVVRTDLPGRNVIRVAALLPIFYSSLVGIIGWEMLLAGRSGFLNVWWRDLTHTDGTLFEIYSYKGVIFVMVLFFVPYVVLLSSGAMQSMDSVLEEAAAVSGATKRQILRTVTLPLMIPTIVAAALVVFVLSMEMFSIPLILGSRDRLTTLAGWIYVNTRGLRPSLPHAAAAGAFLLLIILIGLFIYRRVSRRSGRYVTVAARGYKPNPVLLGRSRIPLFVLTAGVLFVSTVLPVLAVALRSVMKVRTPNLSWDALGLVHYRKLFDSDDFKEGVKNTLFLGILGGLICMVIGLLVGFWRARRRSPAVSALDYLLAAPVAIPGILLGLGFLWAYVTSPLYLTIWLLLIVLVTRYAGIAVQTVSAGVIQIDRTLEEAAAVSGASEFTSLRTVTFPLLRPVLVSVWFVTFLTITRELSASVLLYGNGSRTLSILTWEYLQDGVFGSAAAIAVVQIMVLAVLVMVLRVAFKVDVSSASRRTL